MIEYDCTFQATLVKRERITQDTYLFGFESQENILLKPAEHFQILMKDKEGLDINRNYTPIISKQVQMITSRILLKYPLKYTQLDHQHQSLKRALYTASGICKKNLGNLHMEEWDSLLSGMPIEINSPKINSAAKVFKVMLMICGGTGITPAFSIIQHICKQPEDQTQLYLLYANKTQSDILLQSELEEFAKNNRNFHYTNILNQQPDYQGFKGYVTLEVMKEVFPTANQETIATYCGPTEMNKVVLQLYKQFGVASIVKF